MRSLWLTAALAVALMLDGCRGKRQPEPVPGPQSALVQRATADAVVRDNITGPRLPFPPARRERDFLVPGHARGSLLAAQLQGAQLQREPSVDSLLISGPGGV
jgi:hypothetical protein